MTDAPATRDADEYGLRAERLEPANVTFVDAAAVNSREHVLDIARGTGDAALRRRLPTPSNLSGEGVGQPVVGSLCNPGDAAVGADQCGAGAPTAPITGSSNSPS